MCPGPFRAGASPELSHHARPPRRRRDGGSKRHSAFRAGPNAPDSYTVKTRDTLWGISGLFLKSPWRWPELWGMNLEQIRNPHLIYPGQVLFLDKSNGRARLRLGQPVGGTAPSDVVRLAPRVRSTVPSTGGISSIPFNLIEPFLNEAVIFDNDELVRAPRIVAAQEGSVLLSRGSIA